MVSECVEGEGAGGCNEKVRWEANRPSHTAAEAAAAAARGAMGLIPAPPTQPSIHTLTHPPGTAAAGPGRSARVGAARRTRGLAASRGQRLAAGSAWGGQQQGGAGGGYGRPNFGRTPPQFRCLGPAGFSGSRPRPPPPPGPHLSLRAGSTPSTPKIIWPAAMSPCSSSTAQRQHQLEQTVAPGKVPCPGLQTPPPSPHTCMATLLPAKAMSRRHCGPR